MRGDLITALAVLMGVVASNATVQAGQPGDYIWSQCNGESCTIAEVREITSGTLDSFLSLHLLRFEKGKIDSDGETDGSYPSYTIICGNKNPTVNIDIEGTTQVRRVDLKKNTLNAAVWTYVCTGKVKSN